MKSRLVFACLILVLFSACRENYLGEKETQLILSEPTYFNEAFEKLTEVIVHDIFSPPVASRVYAYPTIAAYETIASKVEGYQSYGQRLNGLDQMVIETPSEDANTELAALVAFLRTAQALVFSQDEIEQFLGELKTSLQNEKIDPRVLDASFTLGQNVSAQIIEWANTDNYAETRSASSFSVTKDEGRWKPTPPAFMEGIEPHWREMRTMLIKDLSNYQPKTNTPFNNEKDSSFYQEVLETKLAVDQASAEQQSIAAFWDCNPYVMNVTGHLMYASKKITPGGHWMGICTVASKNAKLSLAETIEIHSRVAIAIYDSFISCWDEKYRSNLVRPETVINEYIDPDWKPFLQTPPFPEHTSGHSVISTAAAVVLTDYFGDDFAYTDNVEVKYGLPERSFTSFRQAASEAAISRLYGGIHYRPAIEDGETQGEKIGKMVARKLSSSKN